MAGSCDGFVTDGLEGLFSQLPVVHISFSFSVLYFLPSPPPFFWCMFELKREEKRCLSIDSTTFMNTIITILIITFFPLL